jgi:formate-dependent phosphoribosylglycinamide formyltransferase (GAR transformylase)
MKDAVICLAAGKSQEPLIAKAKTLGYVVIAIDRDKASPGFQYADIKIYQSTYDADTIIQELESLQNKFRWIGVLNRSSGPPVITAAKICKHFNIPGVPIESAKTLVNKDKLRIACIEYNIPSPKYRIYDIEKCDVVDSDELPVVVKPALSLIGKSGISVVRSKNELKSSINYAVDNTINKKIIVEEFLKGPDLTFVSFVRDGSLCPICLLDEINIEKEDGSIIGKGYKTHSRCENNWMSKASQIAQQIMTIFKIERSAFIVSYRVDSQKNLKLTEVHLDLGGDLLIEEVFPKALPFDFLEFSVHMSVGGKECPSYFDIKPTAIYYDNGDGLLTDKSYMVFTANSDEKLEKLILEANM